MAHQKSLSEPPAVFRRNKSGIFTDKNWLKVGLFFADDPKKLEPDRTVAEWTDHSVAQQLDSIWMKIEKEILSSIAKKKNTVSITIPLDILVACRPVICAEFCKLGFTEFSIKRVTSMFEKGVQTRIWARRPS